MAQHIQEPSALPPSLTLPQDISGLRSVSREDTLHVPLKDPDMYNNWAGNLRYASQRVLYPRSNEELASMPKSAQKVKVLGSRHCFNAIADSDDTQISLSLLHAQKRVSMHPSGESVYIHGQISYGELALFLEQHGRALQNLASLPHISVAGACATGTHGSGQHASLAAAVRSVDFMLADGTVRTLHREREAKLFQCAAVHLGALGIVAGLELDVVPSFQMQQNVYLNLPFQELFAHHEEIFSSAYSVSLFLDWKNPFVNQVWLKSLVPEGLPKTPPACFFGAKPALKQMHPIEKLSGEHCTAQLNVAGPWYDRLPHFRLDATPSAGAELQSEYIIPREHLSAAVQALSANRAWLTKPLMISEIRSIPSDTLWLSPAYGRDSVGIHFTWAPEKEAVASILPHLEAVLAPFEARPHWGKIFAMGSAKLATLYPKFDDFRRLASDYDPEGKFSNAFLKEKIGLHEELC